MNRLNRENGFAALVGVIMLAAAALLIVAVWLWPYFAAALEPFFTVGKWLGALALAVAAAVWLARFVARRRRRSSLKRRLNRRR